MQDSVLLNQNLSMNLNNDRMEHIRGLVAEYLRDGISEIGILNVAEASMVFQVFKEIYSSFDQDKKGNKKDAMKMLESTSIRSKDSVSQSTKSSKVGLVSPVSLNTVLTREDRPLNMDYEK